MKKQINYELKNSYLLSRELKNIEKIITKVEESRLNNDENEFKKQSFFIVNALSQALKEVVPSFAEFRRKTMLDALTNSKNTFTSPNHFELNFKEELNSYKDTELKMLEAIYSENSTTYKKYQKEFKGDNEFNFKEMLLESMLEEINFINKKFIEDKNNNLTFTDYLIKELKNEDKLLKEKIKETKEQKEIKTKTEIQKWLEEKKQTEKNEQDMQSHLEKELDKVFEF
ncbi:hypothetical protein [[Mycoplasma] gypis]|uniref:ICEF Integrative Conjugal Element-II n=1 Tax=[Mycoplasma] gypis TaxID=92404 RepID=A0ABZ2RW95_9BACT|nr:hypothetical protein [[Mycoplasma] gypis]MBN0919392.1 hypothetical protein [[Mycoplasma] gypis]